VNQTRFDDVAGLASLAEPTRRALYLYVQAQDSAVSRDEAAAGVGVPRHKAKFHLDKLAEDGLLEVEFARRTGRDGPGAGRPAKLYRRASRELVVSLPERRYELAGQLMARAISDVRNTGAPVAGALRSAALDRGRRLAEETLRGTADPTSRQELLAAARSVLDAEGYETRADPAGLTLANCPFHALAAEHRDVVCAMNLAIMKGLLGRLGPLGLAAVPDPAVLDPAAPNPPEGRCCVRLAGHR
jgi:predicted ArsR family transcriptional regulator